jgi:hypothetical protein
MLARMKELVVFAALIAATAGCQKRHEETLDCSIIPGTIDRMMESAKGELPPDAFARVQEVAPKLKEAITKVCREDKWSEEVLDCHRIASTQADINLCQAKLTPPQRAHTDKTTQEVIETFNKGSAAGSAQGSAAGSAK